MASERWDLTVSILHFSNLFNKQEHPILSFIFWGIYREESEGGYLRSTSGQRTSGFLHCDKMTEEVAPVSMFIENRLGNIYKCTFDTKSRCIFNLILVSPTVLEEKNLPNDQLSLMGRSILSLTTMTYVYHRSIPSIASIDIDPSIDSSHCKKRLMIFPSPAGISPTKLSLGGNNNRESFVGDIPAGDGKIDNLFLQCAGYAKP